MNEPDPDDDYPKLAAAFERYQNADELTAVIVSTALVEIQLRVILRHWIHPDDLKKKRYWSFGYCTDVGEEIGCLPSTLAEDLRVLATIRNEFAHAWEPRSLDEPEMAALVRTIHPYVTGYEDSAIRDLFNLRVGLIWQQVRTCERPSSPRRLSELKKPQASSSGQKTA